MSVAMPGEAQLPPGPHRDLVAALHKLYEMAGKPSTRKVSRLVLARDDLPATVSHETVGAMLGGRSSVPRWDTLECVVRVLAGKAVEKVDVDAEVLRIQLAWVAADAVKDRHPHQDQDGLPNLPARDSGLYAVEDVSVPSASNAAAHAYDAEIEEVRDLPLPPPALGATGVASEPLMRWESPGLGTFEFFDREMALEVIKGLWGGSDV